MDVHSEDKFVFIAVDEMFTKQNRKAMLKKFFIIFGEFFGTAVLVFATCMGCTAMQHEFTIVQNSFNSGIAVTTIIHIFGHVSGAHVNPAVSMAAVIMKQITVTDLMIYVPSQLSGAMTGYALLMVITPKDDLSFDSKENCVTLPHNHLNGFQATLAELLLTVILVFAVCATWDNRNNNKIDSVSLRIGFIVVMLNLGGSTYTGSSMNPARSFGPAVFHGNFHMHWVYWIGPCLGAIITSLIYRIFLLHNQTTHE